MWTNVQFCRQSSVLRYDIIESFLRDFIFWECEIIGSFWDFFHVLSMWNNWQFCEVSHVLKIWNNGQFCGGYHVMRIWNNWAFLLGISFLENGRKLSVFCEISYYEIIDSFVGDLMFGNMKWWTVMWGISCFENFEEQAVLLGRICNKGQLCVRHFLRIFNDG